MQRMTVILAALLASACSSGAPAGTGKRMAECHSLPPREAYYCNKRLSDEVEAIKKAEASRSEQSLR